MFDLHFLLTSVLNVVWIAGIVLAFRRWRCHPQVSLLIVIALGLELARSVGGMLASYWLSIEFRERTSGEALIVYFAILRNALSGLDILAWTLVLIALFRWRYPPNRLLGYDGQYLPEDFLLK